MPRFVFRSILTTTRVLPICVAGAAMSVEAGCRGSGPLLVGVACQGFGLNESCFEPSLPVRSCTPSGVQFLVPPARCSGQVYVELPAVACQCADGPAYVACTWPTGPAGEEFEGCACDAPPAGYSPACETKDGLSSCLVDAGYVPGGDCADTAAAGDAAASPPPSQR